jgi:hypothetical protein
MLVFELSSGLFQFGCKGPSVQFGGGEVILFGDVLRPQEAQPVELHLQGAAVFVGVAFDGDVSGCGDFA